LKRSGIGKYVSDFKVLRPSGCDHGLMIESPWLWRSAPWQRLRIAWSVSDRSEARKLDWVGLRKCPAQPYSRTSQPSGWLRADEAVALEGRSLPELREVENSCRSTTATAYVLADRAMLSPN